VGLDHRVRQWATAEAGTYIGTSLERYLYGQDNVDHVRKGRLVPNLQFLEFAIRR
jgi:hypothetical protein